MTDNESAQFKKFEDNWKPIQHSNIIKEVKGDLFEQNNYSLAHCVAADLRMEQGIAVDFKNKFKNVKYLLDQNPKPGGIATLFDDKNNRFIYYLITKEKSNKKPTYFTLWKALNKMKTHAKENYKYRNSCMPATKSKRHRKEPQN
ncbi:ADP-ribose glycohydrolase OARD1-like [Cylas formicarius]|uniref:ADP-ribose glycohydrolase OARD1-like n=1 Tax=Cylas formicarius TaxID=197179 RepID=UPI002958837A|nr:ADP-ribose glycohydrolase OARD1-like [Cylas formicarius]